MRKYLVLFLTVATILFQINGCKDEDEQKQIFGNPVELTEYGWELFEVSDYQNAVRYFSDAIAADRSYSDAWTGLGWSYLRQANIVQAYENLSEAVRLSPNSNDAQAGLAFCQFSRGEYVQADSSAQHILNRSTIWQFTRDRSIELLDLKVLQVSARYLTGNFVSALALLRTFDPDFNCDINTPEGLAELSNRIEMWSRR
ncbi:MAG: hypothetical protein N2450_02655 [bacterium]|nr:hypothetical protein [bacterium]